MTTTCGRFSLRNATRLLFLVALFVSPHSSMRIALGARGTRGRNLQIKAQHSRYDHARSLKEENMSVPEMIVFHGYPVEVHHVTTEDGYIIELHRIPPKQVGVYEHHKNDDRHREEEGVDYQDINPRWAYKRSLNDKRTTENQKTRHRRRIDAPIAVLPNCFMCNSAAWVVLGSKKAIPYILHERGYDVWMINGRGSSYSRNHTTISQRKKKFWKFGPHEMGLYDVSASIDFVLENNENRAQQVDVVGYSMGIAQLFILLSERPEYNKKVRRVISVAASIFIGDNDSMMSTMSAMLPTITDFFVRTSQLIVPPKDWDLNAMFSSACRPGVAFMEALCQTGIRLFTGTAGGREIQNRLPIFFKHFPDTTSLRVIVHLGQWVNSGLFQKMDFGPRLNRRVYNGSLTPPSYNLDAVQVPVYMIYSEGDTITGPTGMKTLRSKLSNVVEFYKVPRDSFTHWDYTWADDAYEMVNLKVAQMLES